MKFPYSHRFNIFRHGAFVLLSLALLGSPFVLPAQGVPGDYRVKLEYESGDFATSRKVLLQLVGRYGRLVSMENQAGTRLSAEFLVPSPKLADFLAEMGSVGHGRSETLEAAADTKATRGLSRVSLTMVPRAVVAAESQWPDFMDAFSGLAFFLARLGYVLIWMAPLWILLGLLFWKRRIFIDAFKSAGQEAARVLPSKQNHTSGE